MRVKLGLLIAGGVFVALASRWMATIGIGFGGRVAAAMLFLLGQAAVRFEDYPGGKEWVAKLERYFKK